MGAQWGAARERAEAGVAVRDAAARTEELQRLERRVERRVKLERAAARAEAGTAARRYQAQARALCAGRAVGAARWPRDALALCFVR